MQLTETMELIPPSGDGHFCWLMIFEDGVRIDLSVEFSEYIDDGEPVLILLDKDGFLPKINPNKKHWYIKKPSEKHFYDCCNEFWWCLNNVAKGIARDELPYAMNMYNCSVKDMLDRMIEWFIGVNYDFSVSEGKNGRYFKKFLSETLYEKYKETISDSDYVNFWNSITSACELFHLTAEKVADYLDVRYDQTEENGMLKYLKMVKNDCT
jgi:aminoglycoside 6-adenylyltransferase